MKTIPMQVRPSRTLLIAVALATAGCMLVILSYWPGLRGPFLLDDIGSIGDLGRHGGVTDWRTFREFVFGGSTGPTGRPLALMSFLLDGTTWPTDPWPFKRTNLIIHLLNGVLIGSFGWQVLRIIGIDSRQALIIAAVSSIAWAAHPFLVSTVLYPVQRMAQLAALFCLLGLNVYTYARRRIPTRSGRSYLTMSAAIALFTVLATFSKENGALLPLLVLIFEVTVVGGRTATVGKLATPWFFAFLLFPSLLLAGYLVRLGFTADLFAQQPIRGFSLYERLLTEARVLMDYLLRWFTPSLYTSGVFQDHFQKSTGILTPPSTLISLAVHFGAMAFCWAKRNRYPILAFGMLFFYAGHVLESTTVNLELYFEHRNYLPAAFLFLPICAWLVQQTSTRIAAPAALAVCLLLAGFTYYSSTIWSSYREIVVAAAHAEPDSSRAQQQYSSILYNEGRVDDALKIADDALLLHPDDQRLNLWRALLGCRSGALTGQQFDEIAKRVGEQDYDLRNLSAYQQLIDAAMDESCSGVTPDSMSRLLNNLLSHPTNQDPTSIGYAQLSYLKGQVELLLDNPVSAMESFQNSLRSREGADRAMMMAAIMASHGRYDFALSLSETALDYVEKGVAGRGLATGVARSDILEFQSRVRQAMQP